MNVVVSGKMIGSKLDLKTTPTLLLHLSIGRTSECNKVRDVKVFQFTRRLHHVPSVITSRAFCGSPFVS